MQQQRELELLQGLVCSTAALQCEHKRGAQSNIPELQVR